MVLGIDAFRARSAEVKVQHHPLCRGDVTKYWWNLSKLIEGIRRYSKVFEVRIWNLKFGFGVRIYLGTLDVCTRNQS